MQNSITPLSESHPSCMHTAVLIPRPSTPGPSHVSFYADHSFPIPSPSLPCYNFICPSSECMICLILIPLFSQTILTTPSAQEQLTLPRNLYHIYFPWWGRLVDFDIITRISYDPERRAWIRRKKENETGNFRPPLMEHRAIMCSLLALSNPFEGKRIYIKCRMACLNLYFLTEEPFRLETNYKPWSQSFNKYPSHQSLFIFV